MAEIRDIQEELRRLRCEIGEINKRFDAFACASETLDDPRVTVDRHEAEMVELRRRGELGSAPSPPLNQQTENDRFPISPFTLGNAVHCLGSSKRFYAWALLHQSEDGLNHSWPTILMTAKKSRTELEIEYGRRIVEQSPVVWSERPHENRGKS